MFRMPRPSLHRFIPKKVGFYTKLASISTLAGGVYSYCNEYSRWKVAKGLIEEKWYPISAGAEYSYNAEKFIIDINPPENIQQTEKTVEEKANAKAQTAQIVKCLSSMWELQDIVIQEAYSKLGIKGPIYIFRKPGADYGAFDCIWNGQRTHFIQAPCEAKESLDEIYAIAGHEGVHVLHRHLPILDFLSIAVASALVLPQYNNGLFKVLTLYLMITVPLHKLAEIDSDLSSTKKLGTTSELIKFLTNIKELEDKEITNNIFVLPSLVSQLISHHPTAGNRIGLLSQFPASIELKKNSYLKTEEFNNLQNHYAKRVFQRDFWLYSIGKMYKAEDPDTKRRTAATVVELLEKSVALPNISKKC